MVTKPSGDVARDDACFILAKNHMVTKPKVWISYNTISFILAKNHMVTKLDALY